MTGLHRGFCIDATLYFGDSHGTSVGVQMHCRGLMNSSHGRYKIVDCPSPGLLQPAGVFGNVLRGIWSNTKSMTSACLGFFLPGYTQPEFILSLPKGEAEYELISANYAEEETSKKDWAHVLKCWGEQQLQWAFLECTWTAAASCVGIHCPDWLTIYSSSSSQSERNAQRQRYLWKDAMNEVCGPMMVKELIHEETFKII